MCIFRSISTTCRFFSSAVKSNVFVNTSLPQRADLSGLPKKKIEATRGCLRLIQSQPKKYAKMMIHSFNFTVTERDRIITHRIRGVKPGEILEFDKIREVGSADYTITGQPFVDPRFVTLRACVLENGRGKRMPMEKKRKRKGIHRHKYSNPLTTVLMVQQIIVNPDFPLSEQ